MNLEESLCERDDRVVSKDNTVQFENHRLQTPVDAHSYHGVKTKVKAV